MKTRHLIFILFSIQAFGQTPTTFPQLTNDEIVTKYLKNGAWKYLMTLPEWQLYLDSAIALSPNYAYLYQQKALPYFSQGKYEIAAAILDKAVKADPQAYIDYRAYMKCIYGNRHIESIEDFIEAKKLKGEKGHVFDHSYDFYIGLCYLQLNEFDKAVEFLKKSIEHTEKTNGPSWVHWLDYFYAGIAFQEMQNHEEAIAYFDKSIANHKNFSDAKYHKVISLYRIKKYNEAKSLILECDFDFKAGYSMNVGNSRYGRFPYQVNQELIDMFKRWQP
jgi:tetratricopeptide (TPR) repeat protein